MWVVKTNDSEIGGDDFVWKFRLHLCLIFVYFPNHFVAYVIQRSLTLATALFNHLMSNILHMFLRFIAGNRCFSIQMSLTCVPKGPTAVSHQLNRSWTGTKVRQAII